jgi:hypothetical protein
MVKIDKRMQRANKRLANRFGGDVQLWGAA